ncbi:hypothetical protein D9756_008481 [Leucocoprinus leucothites]|uniref:Uncharacterized protein n=1 Tax=Leucocoprinus leucothites TaxID=201217 RepID=A0A8H5CZY9_9AGAR|nr:hypothetical protein D9756_008481 [Leucoagaricus leucothites]
MASQETPGPNTTTRAPRPEPELETVPLARLTRKTVERLAPFCQIRLPNDATQAPLVPKTNSKILRLIQAVDTSMLVAQIGYRLSSDAATICDPFAPPPHASSSSLGNMKHGAGSTPEMLQTMAAHGHGHCLKAAEAFRDVQQEIYRIAAATKDNETTVLVPPDPQQPANRRTTLKEVGTSLVANLSLLERFARSMTDLTSWWEWLEEELMSPNSGMLPVVGKKDAELCARWGKIKAGYLDYYNTIRAVYTRYPQLFTTSSTAWQSLSSVLPAPSSSDSSWDGSYEDLAAPLGEEAVEENGKPSNSSHDLLKPSKGKKTKEKSNSVTNKERVKALATKLGLAKVFAKKKKPAKGKEKTKEKAEENVAEATSVIDIKTSASPAPMSEKTPATTDHTVIPDTSSPAPASALSQPPSEKNAPAIENGTTVPPVSPMVVIVQGNNVPEKGAELPTEQRDGGVKEKEEKEEKKKSGLAKLFAKLKNVFVKLGCQTGSGIER